MKECGTICDLFRGEKLRVSIDNWDLSEGALDDTAHPPASKEATEKSSKVRVRVRVRVGIDEG